MSIKIKVKKRLFEGETPLATDTTQQQTTDNAAQQPSDNTNNQATDNANNQTVDNKQNNDTSANNDASTNDASTGVDLNQFVAEVTNLYVDICTLIKEMCSVDNFKKHMPLYSTVKETEPYKGLEKDFADAVNGMKNIDPKNFQQGLQQFSKIIEELGKYTTAVTSAAPTTNPAVPNALAASAAPTTGQTTTTTVTNQPAQQQQPLTNNQLPAAQ